MTGQPLLQVVAEHSLEALDAAGAGGFDRLVARLRDCGRSGEAVELLRDDGTTLPARMTHAPRLDAAGRLAGHIFIAHDMTELNEAARLKDEFVGTVSHELRTPLSSILGYLELAKDDESGPLTDEQRHYLAVVERNAQRLLALVGDLLFVAQVDAGKLPLALERLDPNDVLRASAESALPAASRRSIEITCEPSAEPLTIDGDERRVGQAIDNLVSNAVKFTPAGGTVRLASALDGDEVVITVSDTGMGIPADEMRLLFGRFFRATTATRQAVPGVGLGLNITRAIVTAHGGRLSASSTVGKGTTFELRFPAAPATEPARAP